MTFPAHHPERKTPHLSSVFTTYSTQQFGNGVVSGTLWENMGRMLDRTDHSLSSMECYYLAQVTAPCSRPRKANYSSIFGAYGIL